ncbi:hypothetical protein BH20ACT15_BH20ACT15_05440 [soil metagenome]
MGNGETEAGAGELHPAEHRAYRELYVSSRQLINRWDRLAEALEGTTYAAVLGRGRARVEQLLEALAPTTEVYGLHGGIAAQGLGARIADVRGAVSDRSVDTGMVMRFAVLDVEHVATLLGHLGALADARADARLAAFCREWEAAIRPEVEATRAAAISIGREPEVAAAPLDESILGRAAHGVGWLIGSVGEAVDRISGQHKRTSEPEPEDDALD